MLRWSKRILLVICASIALAAGFLHWRSHRISSVGHWYGEKSWVGIYCARGRIVIGIGRDRIDAAITHDYYERPVKPNRDEIEFTDTYRGGQWLGIGYYQSHHPTVGYVLVPIWAIWGLASVPIFIAVCRMFRKSVRKGSNRCVNCGYDLRDSSERCPECGKEMMRPAAPCSGPVTSSLV